MRKPDFIIVGAPKSATTFMYQKLRKHPQIFIPGRKEVHFFGRDLTKEANSFFVTDETRYLKLFRRARADQLVGEASVMYLISRTAAEEIHAMNPEAKIIIMLRNPVEMLYAYHSQLLFGVCEDIEDFGQALEAEPARRRGERMPRYCMIKESLYYSDVAKYAEQVQRYLDIFGREQVLVVLFDDFKADARRVFRETLEFLGVDPDFEPSFEVVNPNTTRRSAWLQAFTWQPPRVVDALLRLLPDGLRIVFLMGIIKINTKVAPRQKLSPVLEEQLRIRLVPEVEQISKLLGRDLSHWVKS